MITKTKYILLLSLLFYSLIITAQQLPQFTQYMYNTISVNPAYAGSRETLSIVGLHRSQWTGIEKGPTTQTLSVHSPLKNKQIGLGLSIINDELGYENFTLAYADASYTIQVSDRTKLALGLKGGFTHYNIDEELLTSPEAINDPFFNNLAFKWNPNFGLGAYLHQNKWYVGLSAPRILNTDYNDTPTQNNAEFVALERVVYYLTAGYVFDISDTLKFKPSALVKATNGSPLSYDVTANFLYNQKIWLGAGYRNNLDTNTLGVLVDFQINDSLRIGYTYETFLGDITPFTGGTHEILLMYEVQKKNKRIKSPRYF